MSLLDCFLELIAFTSYLTSSQRHENVSVEMAEDDFTHIILKINSFKKHGRSNDRYFDSARFAVFAWVDETIFNSDWEGAIRWAPCSLQRRYYNTFNAGEEFYVRLNDALNEKVISKNEEKNEKKQLLEVFLVCLLMGFKGQYHSEENQKILQTIISQTIAVCHHQLTVNQILTLDEKESIKKNLPRSRIWSRKIIIFQITSLFIFILIYYFYQHDLNLMLPDWLNQT